MSKKCSFRLDGYKQKYNGARDIRIEETELPALEKGMVKVKVEHTGICGSDM